MAVIVVVAVIWNGPAYVVEEQVGTERSTV